MTLAATPDLAGPVPREAKVSTELRSTQGTRFLGALLGATAVPFLAIPLIARVTHPNLGVEKTRELIVFIGSGSHVAASFLLYADRSLRTIMKRRPARFFVMPFVIVIGTTLLYPVGHGDVTATALTVYLVWQTYHYTRQNIGVLAFSAKAAGCRSPTSLERAAIMTSGYAGILGMITLLTPYTSTPLRDIGWQLHAMSLLVFVGGLVLMAVALPTSLRTANPWRVGFLLVCVLFYLPVLVFHDVVSATSTYALAHGFQYLVFLWWVARSGRSQADRRAMTGGLLGLVVLGGLVLAVLQDPGHWHHLTQPVFGAYLGLVMIHFVLDAGVWQLRDTDQRAYMRSRFSFLA
jgi:uncharacterized membrane protein